MFGKLSLAAVPYHNMIIMGAVGGALLLALIILGLITYYRKWGYLWKEWLTSLDHKKIGVMYIVLALVMLLRGISDAIMMRSQQAIAAGGSFGYLPPDHFDQIFTAHGAIMILFMAMPFLTGLMNIVVPQQIGARDVAFPFLNAVSLWLTVAAGMLVMVALGVGTFSKAGWSGYPPLTEQAFSPDTGVDYWLWSFQMAGVGSLLTGINFMATILRMRAPGMKLMRIPIFAWTTLFTNVLMIFAFPVISAALALLTLDRYLGMHFFSATQGGNPMMYVNLFWIWGHPEVDIIIQPACGVY
jgi:cytochrome o ubiquinol oxidase subunit 1